MSSPIISLLLEEEPDMVDLLANYINALPACMDKISRSVQSESWGELAESIHNLKGTSGSYGYPLLTDMAGLIELNLKQNQYVLVVHQIKELSSLVDRVMAGAANIPAL